jgi:hypothetical protein
VHAFLCVIVRVCMHVFVHMCVHVHACVCVYVCVCDPCYTMCSRGCMYAYMLEGLLNDFIDTDVRFNQKLLVVGAHHMHCSFNPSHRSPHCCVHVMIIIRVDQNRKSAPYMTVRMVISLLKYRMYTVYIYKCMVLANPNYHTCITD